MEYFAGLDVSMKETAICIIDGKGTVVAEVVVATDPEAISSAFEGYTDRVLRTAMRRARCHHGCTAACKSCVCRCFVSKHAMCMPS
jgi:hypothetical protein